MENNIKGKVVAVTGGTSGIGKAIVLELAKNGVKVIIGARRKEELKKLVEEIRKDGGEAIYEETDVRSKFELTRLVDSAVKTYGRLDVIVNNAGVAHMSRVDDLDIEGWEELIDINLKGVLYGIAAAVPIFKQQEDGHIINILSTSGIKIVPLQGVYAGTKNAIRTISEAFRQESDGKIRITGISPGVTKTNLVNNIKNPEIRTVGLKNMESLAISPQAIANAVVYAMSQPKEVEVGDIVIRPAAQN